MMRQRPPSSINDDVINFERERLNFRVARRSLWTLLNDNLRYVIVGSILILGGCMLIVWNEGSAVNITRTLDEGSSSLIEVMNSADLLSVNEGKLVHIWGMLSIPKPLNDDYFGIKVKAVKLKRRVQVYQWVEEESLPSDDVTYPSNEPSYYYSQAWKDKLIDSSSFYIPYGHENPTSKSIDPSMRMSDIVKIGSFYLSHKVKEEFKRFIPLSSDEQPDAENIKLHNGMYYICRDLFNLQTGDVRVQFYYAGHDMELVSVIGKQVGEVIHPYLTESGRELLLLRSGKLSPDEMFSSEHSRNRFYTWLFRCLGWFILFLGMSFMSIVVQHLALMSPFLREVIFLGLGSANMTLSMSLSLLLVAGAWCFHRPTLAIFIFALATLPFLRAFFTQRRRR